MGAGTGTRDCGALSGDWAFNGGLSKCRYDQAPHCCYLFPSIVWRSGSWWMLITGEDWSISTSKPPIRFSILILISSPSPSPGWIQGQDEGHHGVFLLGHHPLWDRAGNRPITCVQWQQPCVSDCGWSTECNIRWTTELHGVGGPAGRWFHGHQIAIKHEASNVGIHRCVIGCEWDVLDGKMGLKYPNLIR